MADAVGPSEDPQVQVSPSETPLMEMTAPNPNPMTEESAATRASGASDGNDSHFSVASIISILHDEQQIHRAKATTERIFESTPFVALMSILTIWALYSDDIRLAATTKDSDLGFMIIISIAFFLFLIEIFAQSFYKEGYLYVNPKMFRQPGDKFLAVWKRRVYYMFTNGSFYFWLDWLATLSLVLQVCIVMLICLSFPFILPNSNPVLIFCSHLHFHFHHIQPFLTRWIGC